MTSVYPNNRISLQRTGQLCSEILNDKLSKALQYAVSSSIYDAELTLKELNTSQSLLLSLLYGLLNLDITFCLNLIEASSAAVQLKSSYIKVWLKDDFNFKQEDIVKAFSNLAKLMDCKFPSQLKLPQNIAVAFSGLVHKYKLVEVFSLSGDQQALEFVKALSSFVLELTEEVERISKNSSAAAGAEFVKHDVVLATKATNSNKVEEDTTGPPQSAVKDEEKVARSPINAVDDEEPSTSSALPKIERLIIKDEEEVPSQLQPVKGSGPYKPFTLKLPPYPIKAILTQSTPPTSVIDGEAATLSPAQCKIGSDKPVPISFRPLPMSKGDIKSCLEIAVRHNDISTITVLMDYGLNLNEETESGQRLLHLAVYSGCMETVRTLLIFGALPELKNKDLVTPLQLAVQLNTLPIIVLLLKNGADVNQQFIDGNTPVHKAASIGALDTLNTLLRFEPAVNMQNNDGFTAMHLATKAEQLNSMRALINAGADINILSKEGDSCLHISVEKGNIEAINILMRANANPYLKQKSGLNSFHLTHNIDILNYFAMQDVNINSRTSNDDTLLHLVVSKGETELAKRLIELHATVNSTNKEKHTPLIKAIESGNAEMVRLLINAGANIHYLNPLTKDAAIHLAAETGKIECVRLLLDAGADVNMRGYKKWTPVHCAAQGGFSSIVSLLIEKGADVNLRTEDSDTPLHWAAYNGFSETAKILLNNGADINAKGDYGNTPLNIAKSAKKISVINLLKEKGAML